jgi:hypothetical protein
MNCKEIRELLPDVAAGMVSDTSEMKTHIASCDPCAAKLDGLRQTMALLDEWKVPEPSPYFNTRLNAQLRDAKQRPASMWAWIRKPALALSFAALIVAGGLSLGNRSYFTQLQSINTQPPVPGIPAEPGTAVGDLQALEKNHDLYADFDVLDELQVQDDVTANP